MKLVPFAASQAYSERFGERQQIGAYFLRALSNGVGMRSVECPKSEYSGSASICFSARGESRPARGFAHSNCSVPLIKTTPLKLFTMRASLHGKRWLAARTGNIIRLLLRGMSSCIAAESAGCFFFHVLRSEEAMQPRSDHESNGVD